MLSNFVKRLRSFYSRSIILREKHLAHTHHIYCRRDRNVDEAAVAVGRAASGGPDSGRVRSGIVVF